MGVGTGHTFTSNCNIIEPSICLEFDKDLNFVDYKTKKKSSITEISKNPLIRGNFDIYNDEENFDIDVESHHHKFTMQDVGDCFSLSVSLNLLDGFEKVLKTKLQHFLGLESLAIGKNFTMDNIEKIDVEIHGYVGINDTKQDGSGNIEDVENLDANRNYEGYTQTIFYLKGDNSIDGDSIPIKSEDLEDKVSVDVSFMLKKDFKEKFITTWQECKDEME